ncbi:MAG TPA: adenylate/guanylate cyclase domain-containing protein [Smithellaceae bacterium]|nr:adenylate/guanylate cyclase domain-containing protein [Smithellaceae bacterium]HPL67789.1 adenylate/guanylate cyclase domain-containing protein [Smithellaceae bacterium]
MSFATDVEAEVKRIFREQWGKSKATTVPEPIDIALEKNEAKVIDDGTVLYADLSGSTTMVQNYKPHFAAEVYRAYLYSAAQIIRNEGGVITAYDGDRVMAVYSGKTPNTNAATTALKINYAVKNIINPAITAQYVTTIAYTVKQVVGVDRSSLWVARTGVRGDNDLVWVGHAANYAAKLTEISNDDASFITGEVFDRLADSAKYKQGTATLMWRERKWSKMNNMRIYSSNWTWII